MRKRILSAVILLPALMAACDRVERERADETVSQRELALPGAPGTEHAVASSVELPPPPRTERVRPVIERAPPQQPTPDRARIATPEGAQQPADAAIVTIPDAAAERSQVHGPSAEPSTGRTPLEAKGGVGVAEESDGSGVGVSGVIIRGGTGTGLDPCAAHRGPPQVVIDVPDVAAMTPPPLINERTPQIGNGLPLGGAADPESSGGSIVPGRGKVGGQGPAIGPNSTGRTTIGSRGGATRGGIGSRGGLRGGIR